MGIMEFPGGWDADEREAVYACYVLDTGTSALDENLGMGSEISGEILIADTTTEIYTETIIPLHWKAITFDGTNVVYPIGTPQPHEFCFQEQKTIYDEKYWVWDCLEPKIWPSTWPEAVCETAGCGAEIKCDEQHPDHLLTPNSCSEYGADYFGDGCTYFCSLADDISVCRSSAFASDCTASSDCNGIFPNTNIAKCSNGNAYFADKCTSTCSAVDRGDNICRSSAFASDCTASANCNGISPGTWCDGNTKKTCSSSCSYSHVDCRTDAEDSDGGLAYKTSGTCTDYTGCSGSDCQSTSYNDICENTYQVREYYISGSSCSYTIKECREYGSNYYCSNGRCQTSGGGGGGGCFECAFEMI